MFRRHSMHKGLECSTPSSSQNHLKKFTDVNYMIQRAIAGDASVFRAAFSADVSEFPESMHELLNAACRGRDAFLSLPSEVRQHYPTADAFVAALHNPAERDMLVKLGVFKNADNVTTEGGKASNAEAPANT